MRLEGGADWVGGGWWGQALEAPWGFGLYSKTSGATKDLKKDVTLRSGIPEAPRGAPKPGRTVAAGRGVRPAHASCPGPSPGRPRPRAA